jgi:carboxyl-terminal processing protease
MQLRQATIHAPRSALRRGAAALAIVASIMLAQPGAAPLHAADPSAPPVASPDATTLPAPSSGPLATPGPASFDSAALPSGFDRFVEVLTTIRDEFVLAGALDDHALVDGAIRGLMGAIGDDGHSAWLSPEEVSAEDAALDGRVIGIGVLVDTRYGLPEIVSVIPGGPADRAGLRRGDFILAVDGVGTDRLEDDDLVARIRGEPGTNVSLTIRPARGPDRVVTVERASVEVPSVDWAFVPGTRIADLRLLQFSTDAGRDVRDATIEAVSAGATGIILDLRGNPGGLLSEAEAVARVFLDDAVIYRQRDRDGTEREIRSGDRPAAGDLPVVVLTDSGSASSAEIVAAALAENDRATVVGERTFGTGTILGFFPLSDGSALRLGTQQWLTPSGRNLYGTGLAPDLEVALPPGARALEPLELRRLGARGIARSNDRQLRRAIRLLADAG